jgi:hypothetical protein
MSNHTYAAGTWVVPYRPLVDSELASAAICLIPILTLFVLMFLTRVLYAAVTSVCAAIIVACGECCEGCRFTCGSRRLYGGRADY